MSLPASLLALWAGACTTPPPNSVDEINSEVLDRRPDLVSDLDVSPRNRGPIPEAVPVTGTWRVVGTTKEVRTWEAALPIRPRTLFFHRPPKGMSVQRRSGPNYQRSRTIRHAGAPSGLSRVDTWSFSANSVHVRRRLDSGAPDPGEYTVTYSKATQREQDLNRDQFDGTDEQFVFRSLQIGDTTRHGLYLPAPSQIVFDLEIPARAVLDFTAVMVPSEASDAAPADGATLRVEVDPGSGWNVVHEFGLHDDTSLDQRVALGKYAGKARLRLSTDAHDEATLDYVFLAEPTLHVPLADPPRILIVFVDTLRPDHLSVYGYARETTPNLAAWASEATVFEQARSVAPWTLPSARALLLGAQPEEYAVQHTLPARLASAGWSTATMVGNVYLSSNFDMARDWGTHRCINWPPAEIQVGRALDYLDDHPDRPVFLQVHLMDPHLPYTEPPPYRWQFSGTRPDALRSDRFLRSEVTRAGAKLGSEGVEYIKARYDNNIAYVDAQIQRLLTRMGPNDLVVVLSDHGEEFWDHNGFEHGHSLYDELLRVPLLVRGAGLSPGSFKQPTSLLDVAPTIATWAGLPLAGMTGWPLQGLADGSRTSDFAHRPQAFGRPLYGLRAWGVLADGHKYSASKARETLYDLVTDPGESHNRATGNSGQWHQAMATALQREVRPGFRLVPDTQPTSEDLSIELVVPGGVQSAWVGSDPLRRTEVRIELLDQNTVQATWLKGSAGAREVFVLPVDADLAIDDGLRMSITVGKKSRSFAPIDARVAPRFGETGDLLRASLKRRTVRATWAVAPVPSVTGADVEGYDEEVAGDLKALGYTGDD